MSWSTLTRVYGGAAIAAAVSLGFTGAAVAGVPVTAQPKMGDPLDGLTVDQLQRFLAGQTDYNTELLESQGLGPVFNKEFCGNCHNSPLGGTGTQTVTRFGQSDKKGGFLPLEDWGGSLLQAAAIDELCGEVVPGHADITEFRVTNGMMGYGLVEAIADADLSANESNGGRVHWVQPLEDPAGPLRAGRFGHKAQVATILTFSGDAAKNEMGLTNRLDPVENDPQGDQPPLLADCDDHPDPEDGSAIMPPDANGREFIDRVTDFQRFLAAPPQTPKSGMSGEALFNSVNCNTCHVKQYTTLDDPMLEDAIRNKVINPYGDFLLHDMGLAGDPIIQGDAGQRDVRTPPLWGLRMRQVMLHDGDANAVLFGDRIQQVVDAHQAFGSEARPSALLYNALTQGEKDQIVAFLNSLGRAEFDTDGDNEIDLADFHGFGDPAAFEQCFGGGPYTADDACAVHDVDQDGDVDLDDFDVFMTVYEGPRRDCNGNGVVDLRDVLDGTETDSEPNAVPDACEPTCNGDLNGSAGVDIQDLLALLAEWGPCPASPAPCNADIDLDETVGIQDLLILLAAWGDC